MTPRRLCNVVYATLTVGADKEARDKFDRDLYAPVQGWDLTQRRMFALIEGEG